MLRALHLPLKRLLPCDVTRHKLTTGLVARTSYPPKSCHRWTHSSNLMDLQPTLRTVATSSTAQASPLTSSVGKEVPFLPRNQPPNAIQLFMTYAMCLPIWVGTALGLLLDVLLNRSSVWRTKDRSSTTLPLPYSTFAHEWVCVNGIRLHAVSPGRQPNKPLMLMLHGFPECWYSWRHQMIAFRDDYDVVALDMRGYGFSDKPKGVKSYTMDLLAADVVGAVRALGHESCTLVGHDWGGIVAWAVAATQPAAVDRLVVMAAPHPALFGYNRDVDQMRKSWYIMLFQAPWLPEALMLSHDARSITFPTLRPYAARPEDVEVYKQAWQRPGTATAALNYYRAAVRHPPPAVSEALRRQIMVPTLVLWADQDLALNQRLLKHIEEVVPYVEVHIHENCSHWMQQDQPQQVTQHIRSWLGLPAPKGDIERVEQATTL